MKLRESIGFMVSEEAVEISPDVDGIEEGGLSRSRFGVR